MSLAELIQQQMVPVVKCKTCRMLDRLDEQDRAEFAEASGVVPGSILARALSARLREVGIDDTLDEKSVRSHIANGHGA